MAAADFGGDDSVVEIWCLSPVTRRPAGVRAPLQPEGDEGVRLGGVVQEWRTLK